MKFECLHTLTTRHPDCIISKVDHPSQSIFFEEKGREWVMIFDGTTVVGVWDMSPSCWTEQTQDLRDPRRI